MAQTHAKAKYGYYKNENEIVMDCCLVAELPYNLKLQDTQRRQNPRVSSLCYPVQAPTQATKLSPVLLPHARTLLQRVEHMNSTNNKNSTKERNKVN